MSHHTELTPSATTSQAYLATPSTLTNNSWLLDSGATHHVTSNDNSMISKTEDKGYEKLAIGNGDTLLISHFGTCHLPSYRPLALKHLLLVPSITKNLISISKLTSDNDVIVEFNLSYYHVKDKFSKEIPLIGTLCNGLYHLDLSSPSSSSPASFSTIDRHFFLVGSVAST